MAERVWFDVHWTDDGEMWNRDDDMELCLLGCETLASAQRNAAALRARGEDGGWGSDPIATRIVRCEVVEQSGDPEAWPGSAS